jgi:hypothetical protein
MNNLKYLFIGNQYQPDQYQTKYSLIVIINKFNLFITLFSTCGIFNAFFFNA